MVTVYDQKGKAHERAPVDARELCAQGWTMENPKAAPAAAASDDDGPSEIEALQATLTEREVEFNPQLGKKKLQALVDETAPKADPDLND
tara:strand:+ start:34985 stop:35254 length:270 start_codon:yes stop_codon:yes gene_type:complete